MEGKDLGIMDTTDPSQPAQSGIILSLFPRASRDFLKLNPLSSVSEPIKTLNRSIRGAANETTDQCQIPNSKLERNQKAALGGPKKGKAESLLRVKVRFIGYRVRPLDPDNFAGSCKDLLDGLHHCGLIQGDEPWRIIFETAQEKVKSYKEEKTLIEIDL